MSPNPKSRNAVASRDSILAHAIDEFAAQGVAGARTANIADAAKVNKALLYYYFKDKDSLYAASLQEVFRGLFESVQPMLESAISPGEKILRFARIHFEYLLHHPHYPRLIHQELSRAASSGAPSREFGRMTSDHFAPMQRAGLSVVQQGIDSGEFRSIAAASFLTAVVGMNAFYFISAPIMRITRGVDPFSPESVRNHIANSLDFVGAALFADRAYGIKLAKKIASAPTALPTAATRAPKSKSTLAKRATHES